MMDTRQQLQPAHMMMHSNSNRTSTSTNKQFSQLYAAASGLLPTGGNTAWAPSTPQAPAAAWPHAPATPPPSQFPILEKFLSKQPQAQVRSCWLASAVDLVDSVGVVFLVQQRAMMASWLANVWESCWLQVTVQ